MKMRRFSVALVALIVLLALSSFAQQATRFEVAFADKAHAAPITGRVFVIITRRNDTEPRLQVGSWEEETPFFGTDVTQLKPGEPAIIDGATLGYPLRSLKEIPAGDYYVQALVNVYTEFHRADGHTIWAHMDQWEGQQFNLSPGNLYSDVQRVHLDPKTGYSIKLDAEKAIPAIKLPPDTAWVKHIKIQSKLLSQFWGQPIYLGATVLLPKDYDQHPSTHYPVIYYQDHFSTDAPLLMRTSEPEDGDGWAEFGWKAFLAWSGDKFPRMVAVSFQHPTPYYDDSYAVNSANDGPYGDAVMQELIPYIEEHFRIVRQPWARVLTGGSTGGWESLALQLYHPDFFGGTWSFFPDPIDFRRYQLINIYDDANAFYAPGFEWVQRERPLMRTVEGQVVETIQQMSQLEQVLGTHGRSGQQLEAWEAVYGPVGIDGYPKPLWDKTNGWIDRGVADYMREHGFDLRDYAERHWKTIGPQLVSKIHIYCGDMDNYYLNLAVYEMQDFLNQTRNPKAEATVIFGRPKKGHGWFPFSEEEWVRQMGDHIAKHAPAGTDVKEWNY